MRTMPDIDTKDPHAFWEAVYLKASPQSNGRPGQILAALTDSLPAGSALDLGCARGDDAVWLASRGWRVLAVDIAETAIGYARANAERAQLADRIAFERHDLTQTFPEGAFDLVTAMFLQSPVDFPRAEVLRRAAAAVSPGGHLLIAEHASRAPWSWGDDDTPLPTSEETFASLELAASQWQSVNVETRQRVASGPNGETATVSDNVIFIRRLR